MHEFETFVYLEVEKTGSTFIASLLRKHAAERLVLADKHAAMGADCDRSKFYFTSVRDPLDSYISLYSYGCQRAGTFRAELAKNGQGALYDGTLAGFGLWLDFVLEPANAAVLGGGYAVGDGALARLVGLQSFRFLRLACAAGLFAACRSREEIRGAYAQGRLPQFIVRHENFAGDLGTLLRGPLAHAFDDAEAVADLVKSARRMNPSRRVDAQVDDFTLAPDLTARLREREWFLCETFGY